MNLENLLIKLHIKKPQAPYAPTDSYEPLSDLVSESVSMQEALLHCFVKGILIFTGSFGCIHGLLSEFEISYNWPLFALVLFAVSMYLSLIHVKEWLFNLGYPLIFVVFTYSLVQLRVYANSGFQAFINILNEAYSSHFLLNLTRESTETLEDRYLTITVMAIFIGIFWAILLNITLYYSMSFYVVLEDTALPLILGIYIGQYPSATAIALLMFTYVAVFFLKRSEHHEFILPSKAKRLKKPPKKGKKTNTATTKQPRRRTDVFVHKSSAKNMVGICTFALATSLLLTACTLPFLYSTTSSKTSSLKSFTDSYVELFVQNGFASLFNRYASTGGLSNGRLGGVSAVRPDYETDLIVTYVPTSSDTVYLRGFVGASYTGSRWLSASMMTDYVYPDSDQIAISDYQRYNVVSEGKLLYQASSQTSLLLTRTASMTIQNVDAGTHFFIPYFCTDNVLSGLVMVENVINHTVYRETVTLQYTPSITIEELEAVYAACYKQLGVSGTDFFAISRSEEQQTYFDTYTEEVYANYLTLSDTLAEDLASYHDAIGESEDVFEQIALIQDFFMENYTYSLSPGATPSGKDFVSYFLEKQGKGYCAHFASAGAMLLRSYGIPARYVEGYVITQTDVAEGASVADVAYEDYFVGENALDVSSAITVEITDGNAHAWVEVFIDGFGWVPVEFTPPSSDVEYASYSDFLSALSGLLSLGDGDGDTTGVSGTYTDFFAELNFGSIKRLWLLLLLPLLLFLAPLLLSLGKKGRAAAHRQVAEGKGAYDVMISHQYHKMLLALHKKYPHQPLTLPEEVCTFVSHRLESLPDTHPVAKLLAEAGATPESYLMLTLQSCYGKEQITKEEARQLKKYYKLLQKL